MQSNERQALSPTLILALASVFIGSACTGATDVAPSSEFSFDSGSPPVSPSTPGSDPPASNDLECAQASGDVRAEVGPGPVDIIWVVDASGSMENEALRVQENLNRFAEFLESGNIDARFVLITYEGFVEVPPPLGVDSERFLFVDRRVGSLNSLVQVLDAWPSYSQHLRDNSMVHVVSVTDDESMLTADCFIEEMTAKLGPSRDFRLHTFSSELARTPEADEISPPYGDGRCDSPERLASACEGAAAVGRQHYLAAAQTGGATISICTEDWSGAFDLIAENVSQAVSVEGCELALPPVPEGNYLDLSKVRVSATGLDGGTVLLNRVAGHQQCSDRAWYVDDLDAPSQVLLCDSTCDALAAAAATVEIGVQCAWTLR